MVTVQAKAVGQRRPLTPEFALPPITDPGATGSPQTLRDLIARIVRDQVMAFAERQRENLFLRALTAEQIAQAVETGSVRSGGSEVRQAVDEDTAVATALQAFEDGTYYVLIDREQCHDLDEQVVVGDDSVVLFLRLVPLAGG